ncbi:MAG: NADH-quinone oxidoreductase subunit NuoB [Deltaproteobacteria bacterium]|nr:NADH-quinone oxidoreductase subunit NuoB [Deltaproteobacteria bacterium]
MDKMPGITVATTTVDMLLTWGLKNSLWTFAMATSCCGIEFMHANGNRTDLDQMGSVPRPSPRHADVMVMAGTITVKMAPRILRLWEQMPEPKWCIAMGSCAISGDFYRDMYSVVPGIDTMIPVDVYIPGCPPNGDDLMAGLKRLQEKVEAQRAGRWVEPEGRPETAKAILPALGRVIDRDGTQTERQLRACQSMGLDGNEHRQSDLVAKSAGLLSNLLKLKGR